MFNILHLFVDGQTGTLRYLDKTVGPDITEILNYSVVIVISEHASLAGLGCSYCPDYSVYFDRISVLTELLENYYCKYNQSMRIFTKKNINIYSIEWKRCYDITKYRIRKFNDYNISELENQDMSCLAVRNMLNPYENKESHAMSNLRYHETVYTLSEFINLIQDENSMLIFSYNLTTSDLRSDISDVKNNIYQAEHGMIEFTNIDEYIDKTNEKIKKGMEQKMVKLRDMKNFNDVTKSLEFKLLDTDLQTELVGFKMNDQDRVKYDYYCPEVYLGFVPEYYNVCPKK